MVEGLPSDEEQVDGFDLMALGRSLAQFASRIAPSSIQKRLSLRAGDASKSTGVPAEGPLRRPGEG